MTGGWLTDVFSAVEVAVDELGSAHRNGMCGKVRAKKMLTYRLDALILAVYGKKNFDVIKQEQLKQDLHTVLEKPLVKLLGSD